LFVTVASEISFTNLTPASGRQDHTTIKTRKANPLKRNKCL
jgi:hypothetical protein